MSTTGTAVPPPSATTARNAATVLILEGVVLAILGLIALALPLLASLAAAIFIGWILIASGIMGVVSAFATKPHVHFWWSLLSGVIAIAAGVLALLTPGAAIIGLTIVIAAWLAIDGINSAMAAMHLRKTHDSGVVWLVLAAIVDWVLAACLLMLPAFGAVIAFGVIVGIDLFLGGVALVFLGAGLRRKAA
jgi:uncharacterized membrane protein HdeD (DUF308 family)